MSIYNNNLVGMLNIVKEIPKCLGKTSQCLKTYFLKKSEGKTKFNLKRQIL